MWQSMGKGGTSLKKYKMSFIHYVKTNKYCWYQQYNYLLGIAGIQEILAFEYHLDGSDRIIELLRKTSRI